MKIFGRMSTHVLLVVVLVSWLFAPALDAQVSQVQTPNVVGQDPKMAQKTLQQAGLDYQFGGYASTSSKGIPGAVVSQTPNAGSMVPKGSVVTVKVYPPMSAADSQEAQSKEQQLKALEKQKQSTSGKQDLKKLQDQLKQMK